MRAGVLANDRPIVETAWLRVSDVAALLGVSSNTVRRWTDDGRIAAHRSAGGHRRYRRADVAALFPPGPATAGGSSGDAIAGLSPVTTSSETDRFDDAGSRRHDGVPVALAELEHRVRDLSAMADAGAELSALVRQPPGDIARRLAQRLAELTGAGVVDVYLVEDYRMRCLASFDRGRFDGDWEGKLLDVAHWPQTKQAVAQRSPTVIGSRRDPALSPDEIAVLEKWGYHSFAVVPLICGGRTLGAVELFDFVERDFSDVLAVAEHVARVGGNVLDASGAFLELDRRGSAARELVALGGLVSQTRDPQALLRLVADRLTSTIAAAGCDIYGVDGEHMVCLASTSSIDGFDHYVGSTLPLADYPSTVAAIEGRELLVVSGPDDPHLTDEERAIFAEDGFGSELCVPLYAGDKPVGLIDLFDTERRDFAEYLDFIMSVGQMVAGALDNAVLLSDLERQNTLLGELVEVGALSSRTHDVEDALRELGPRLMKTIDADTCEVYSLRGGRLWLMAGFDRDQGYLDEFAGWNDELESYPTTAAAVSAREPLVIAGRDDPRLTTFERDKFEQFGYHSEICVPLVVENHVVGVIDIFDTRRRDYAEYAAFLASVAPIMARTLENSMLVAELEQRNANLRELFELGELIAQTRDLDELARQVAPRLRAALDAESCDIYRVDDGHLLQLVSAERDGFNEELRGRSLDLDRYPASHRALAANEIMVVSDPDDPRLSPEEVGIYHEWGLTSSVSLPLVVEGRAVGLVDLDDVRQGHFDDKIDFVRSLGQLLAGAFEKALLLDRLEEGNRELRSLVDAGLEFGASLDVDEVLRSVAARMRETSDAEYTDIFRAASAGTMRCLVSADRSGFDDEYAGTTYPLDEDALAREAIDTGRTVVCTDIQTDERTGEWLRADYLEWGIQASLDVPLVHRGEVIGLAAIADTRPRDFGHLDLIRGLAQIAAQAIENASLYRRLDDNAHRLELMTEAGLEFASSLDLDQVLLSTARRLCSAIDVGECYVNVTVDGIGGRCLAAITNGEVDEEWAGRRFRIADFPAMAQVMATRRPAFFSLADHNVSEVLREAYGGYHDRSGVFLPLIAKDTVIGAVELFDRRGPRAFSEDDIATAEAVCRVAALAIDNATLYDNLQATNRETEVLNAIGRRAAASLDVSEIVTATTEELREIVAFERASLLLIEDGTIRLVLVSRSELERFSGMPLSALDPRMVERVREERVLRLALPDESPFGRDHPIVADLSSAVVIALFSDDALAGALVLSSPEPAAFDAADTVLLERVGTQLSLAIKNARLYEDIKHMHLSNLKALSAALNAKDYYTLGHAARVSAYMVLFGEKLGWSEELVRGAEEAAYLHDIGKIGISDNVLVKPGKLNDEEWELMRQHPVFSADIIGTLFSEELVLGVRHHHERFDGKGYPDGLAGEQIPLIARAMCVVDSYDAMSFQRPYRQALSSEQCREELTRCRGEQFDPEMADAFFAVLDELATKHERAKKIAAEAAARIDGDAHVRLCASKDQEGPEYAAIREILREVRDANPPTHFLTTQARFDRRYVVVVDPEDDMSQWSGIGEDIFPDEVLQVLPKVLGGEDPLVNALIADQFGVWITGLAPVRDSNGEIVAAVGADLPPFEGAELGGLRNQGKETLASILRSAAVRSTRTEIDSITDGLTGLYNHRYFHERADEELRRAADRGTSLAVLFCDLDRFSAFNDEFGHRAGDNALRAVAHVIEQSIRQVDLAARYGGEQFAVVLLDTDHAGAVEVADRIRRRVGETWVAPGQQPLSISIGLALFPDDGEAKEQLLDKADWAMHLAKRRGRDRVVAFDPDGPDEVDQAGGGDAAGAGEPAQSAVDDA